MARRLELGLSDHERNMKERGRRMRNCFIALGLVLLVVPNLALWIMARFGI